MMGMPDQDCTAVRPLSLTQGTPALAPLLQQPLGPQQRSPDAGLATSPSGAARSRHPLSSLACRSVPLCHSGPWPAPVNATGS
ncbi:hypothetical protein NDU88_007135 [Pleurodeles waltl]|uniref:Uncharacterized protein n=1 Tax=Pleurodeles waltl TaxID=8319 RepID=A0AAV7TZT6_PLEWA|nr:hypothetical protein NDU88_007135 [Pleurodeles waltl]